MKTVTIKHGCLGRYDDVSPFLVEDGTLALHFVLPRVSGEFYLAVHHHFENGQSTETIRIPASGDVGLSGLQAGELHAEVKHYLHGELIETFPVESLLIKDVDGAVHVFHEIRLLDEKIEAQSLEREKRDAETREAFARLSEAQRAQEIAFLAFAWTVYRTSFTVNKKNLSLEAFVASFGYGPLTEEETKKIETISEVL